MAMRLSQGVFVRDVFATKTLFYVRNILRWEQSKGYGIRLLLTKEGSPTKLYILSLTHSPKDPKWTTLCAALGLDPFDIKHRKGIVEALLQKDLLTVLNADDKKKATILKAESGDNNPGPFFVSQMTEGQRKFLGGVVDIALITADSELALIPTMEIGSTEFDDIEGEDV